MFKTQSTVFVINFSFPIRSANFPIPLNTDFNPN